MAFRTKLRFFQLRLLPQFPPLSTTILPFPFSATNRFAKPISSLHTSVPCFHPFPSYTSDFEEELGADIVPPDDAELSEFLKLVGRAREEDLRLLKASDFRPTKGFVLSAIWQLRKDWESGMLAFRWGEECVSDCLTAWHLMIWALGKQGKFGEAWSVLRRMRHWKLPMRRALEIMMERYVASNEVKKAIKTFHAMEKFNIFANSSTFYALLRALCKYKNVEEAEDLLYTDKKLFPLEIEGFNILLDGWCNSVGDVTEAKRVWREMSNCCIYPDDISYTHMICCFSQASNLFDSLRLYDEMRKRSWSPNLKIYNSLIHVLTREGCLADAYALFDKIEDEGLKADASTYNSMIHPLCEANKLCEAQGLLEKMIACGIKPTTETYHAFAMVEIPEATFELLEKMRSTSCGPNSSTFHLIFGKFLRMNQPEYAVKLWSQMESYSIKPDSSHYIELVHGLTRCGWIFKAKEIYQEMISRGFPPDPKIDKIFKEWVSQNEDPRSLKRKIFKVQNGGGRVFLGEKVFS